MSGLRLFRFSAVLFAFITLSGCVTDTGIDKSRGEALQQYAEMVRWNEWDGAVNFIAPEYLEENPVTRLELDRLRLFRVTGYTVRSTQLYDEGRTVTQVVDISLFLKSKAVERVITDQQVWRYDEEVQGWFLHSGLPDPTQRY